MIPIYSCSRLDRRAVAVLAVVALVMGLLAVTASPAAAVSDVRLTSPSPDSQVSGPTTVRVEVDARALEEVESVEVRLRRDGRIVGPATQLGHADGETSGGTSRWSTSWDPNSGWMGDGQDLSNGTYKLEARAMSSVAGASDEASGWSGHNIVVSTGVDAPSLDGRAANGHVQLQWTESDAPNFMAYRLQRSKGNGPFETITTVGERGATSYRDTPPESGTWRYRVTAVHGDGAGGEQTATSGVVSVDFDGGDGDGNSNGGGGNGDNGGDGDSDSDSGSDSDGDSSDGGNGDEGADGGAPSGGRASGPGLREGSAPPPSSSGTSSVPGFDETAAAEPEVTEPEGGFDEELPYGDPDRDDPDQLDVESADARARDGAVLSVAGREFALEETLPPVAGGLLLFVTAGHVLRLRQQLD